MPPTADRCRCALLSRGSGGRRVAVFTADVDPAAELDTLVATASPPIAWPQSGEVQRFASMPGDTPAARLWCAGAMAGAAAGLEVALDLGAAAHPAQWLERIEDRLLEACSVDPGPYAALACWCGPTDAEAPP